MKNRLLLGIVAFLLMIGMSGLANATVIDNQGFETGAGDWNDLTQVASGTNGIASADGNYHGLAPDAGYSYTWFNDFANRGGAFPSNGYSVTTDIYLDIDWTLGSGFDWSVAAYKSDGSGHLQDFIFNVTKDTSTGDLLVSGSNNTNFDPIENLETRDNYYIVNTSGWYTFEHSFYNDNGVLAVDLNLLDGSGNPFWTETRKDPNNIIPGVAGGHGYGWFTHINIDGGLAVDNVILSEFDSAPVPEPGTFFLFGLGILGVAGMSRRKK